MPVLPPELVGSISTGLLAICSQIVNKCRCYTTCVDGVPQVTCGFSEATLKELQHTADDEKVEEK